MSATQELVAFVQNVDPGSLPAGVVVQAKRCVLDLIGVALAGSGTSMARASTRWALGQFAPGCATVIGAKVRLAEVGATWVNGICASALDLDDGHRLAMGHPGAAVIPTALAVAETTHASGADLLAAVVAGYEMAVRVSVSRLPNYKAHHYSTGIWGVLGSVAAAARLLELDALIFQHALGIAIAHGPFPPRSGFLLDSMVKEVIGWAGVVGCSAAFLAREGFAGPEDGLDRAGRHDPDQLVADLGDGYAIEKTYFKPYASCRWSHPPIDGALQLAGEHGLQPEEINEIRVDGFREITLLDEYAPTSTVAAQYSVPFAIALALTHGGIGPRELTAANLEDEALLGLARKVKLSVDPEIDRLFPARTVARVTLDTAHGTFATTIDYPKGNPENPMSDDELGEKFTWLASEVVGQERSTGLRGMVEHLEELDDVSRLTALLAS